jgi:polyisoprenoid-binding protein YceI
MSMTYRLLPAALALFASASVWGSDAPANFEREVPAQAKGTVEISSTNGTIDVTGWDRPAVGVKAELGAEVDHVEVTSSGDHTVVRVIQRHSGWGHEETHLRVQVPKDSSLEVSGVSANVRSAGVLGTQRLKTVSGDVTADIGPADIEVKSVSGSLKLRGKGQPAKLHVSTVSGDLELKHGAGDLEATTVSGEATVELDPARSVRLRTTSGDLTFEGRLVRGADFDAQSVSGDLKVRAGSEDGFEFEAASVTGDISDCFNVEAERTNKYGPGSKLNGSRGGGGGHVRLKTMSGEIELCDRK